MNGIMQSQFSWATTAPDQAFIGSVMRAMVRAMDLLVNERSHHDFCIRSPTQIQRYAEEWPLFWNAQWDSLTDEQKQSLQWFYEHIKISAETAQRDVDRDYEAAKRRSIILLADLIESFTESVMALCAAHSTKTATEFANFTKYKIKNRNLDLNDPSVIRNAIRKWEKKSFPTFADSRAKRINAMFLIFMPLKFEQQQQVDEIFYHRNRLTHEVVQIDQESADFRSFDASSISIEACDGYFDATGNFILATMEAFKSYKPAISLGISH